MSNIELFLRGCQLKMAAELLEEEAREEVPVAVIGGGIVGPVMAYILGERGIRVHLYEARGKGLDRSQGRAINLSLSSRGMDALVRIGISEEVLKETAPFYGRCIHLPNSGGETKLQYYSVKKEAVHSMNRRRLSELLLKKLEENPYVKIYYEHKLMNIEHQNNTLHFNVKRAGEEKESSYKISIKAKFIIGCDGFSSSVRKSVLGSILHYEQDILDEVYHELYLPPTQNGDSALQHSNMFHVWPLGEVMLVGVPNKGNSFNIILFIPLSVSKNIKTPNNVLEFFKKYFPDLLEKFPNENQLIEDFFRKTPSRLNTIKCYPYHYGNILLLGDASHSVLPFYGQGMNAGLEDCLIFEECLEEKDGDLERAAELFTDRRWKDLHTLADQSLHNFTTLREGVNSSGFWINIKLESLLSVLLPSVFKQIYPMVVFSRGRYSEIHEREKWQKKLVNMIAIIIIIIMSLLIISLVLTFVI